MLEKMTQTDNALFIVEVILLLFGVPLIRASFSGNMVNINCVGLILHCSLILYQGMWLEANQ